MPEHQPSWNRATKPARLTVSQRKRWGGAAAPGARPNGVATGLWKLHRVADLNERHFGVSGPPGHVWYVRRAVGFSSEHHAAAHGAPQWQPRAAYLADLALPQGPALHKNGPNLLELLTDSV